MRRQSSPPVLLVLRQRVALLGLAARTEGEREREYTAHECQPRVGNAPGGHWSPSSPASSFRARSYRSSSKISASLVPSSRCTVLLIATLVYVPFFRRHAHVALSDSHLNTAAMGARLGVGKVLGDVLRGHVPQALAQDCRDGGLALGAHSSPRSLLASATMEPHSQVGVCDGSGSATHVGPRRTWQNRQNLEHAPMSLSSSHGSSARTSDRARFPSTATAARIGNRSFAASMYRCMA